MKSNNLFILVLMSINSLSLIIASIIIKNAFIDIDYPNSWNNLKDKKVQTRIDFINWFDDNKQAKWILYDLYYVKSSDSVSVDLKNGKRCELLVRYVDDKIQDIVIIKSNIYFGFFNTANVIYDKNKISSTIIN